jgi:hypothetical protein
MTPEFPDLGSRLLPVIRTAQVNWRQWLEYIYNTGYDRRVLSLLIPNGGNTTKR